MSDAISSRRFGHVPVLLSEVTKCLAGRDGQLLVDGTFGHGGYSEALLKNTRCSVVALDRDPAVQGRAQELCSEYAGRFNFSLGCFGDLDEILGHQGIREVDGGLVLDLGVSSSQLNDPSRGFSFRFDGPLDMRMSADGDDAAGFVNQADERTLTEVIYNYGEERRARAVAKEIIRVRNRQAITRTGQLADLIRRVVKKSVDGLDPATRTFQAIRIHINNELEELQGGLAAAERILAAGSRLVIVSFHSLEDRLVKTFLSERAGKSGKPNRHEPGVNTGNRTDPSFSLLNKRVIKPTAQELRKNPRSRSARLRAAIRTTAPVWPMRVFT